MENLNATTISLAVLGMTIHLLMYVIAKTKGKNKFRISIFLQDTMNWIRLVLAIISTISLLLMLDDISAVLGVNMKGHDGLLKIIAFAAGYFNHSLIKNILKIFKKTMKVTEI